MRTHWREYKLRDAVRQGVHLPMARHHLYNESGLMIGRVEKTTWGQWQAFTGRPGVDIGYYDTLGEAKGAVEGTLG